MALQRSIHTSALQALTAMKQSDLSADLDMLDTPTLVIYGKQDRTVPASDIKQMQQKVPHVVVHNIDQCGHFPMYEHRDVFLDDLLAFLRQDNIQG